MATHPDQGSQSSDELPLHPARRPANATAANAAAITTTNQTQIGMIKAAHDPHIHDAQDSSSRPPSNFSSASFRSLTPDLPSLSPSLSPVASPKRSSRASGVQPPSNVQNFFDNIAALLLVNLPSHGKLGPTVAPSSTFYRNQTSGPSYSCATASRR